jgi:hypothetical protein
MPSFGLDDLAAMLFRTLARLPRTRLDSLEDETAGVCKSTDVVRTLVRLGVDFANYGSTHDRPGLMVLVAID